MFSALDDDSDICRLLADRGSLNRSVDGLPQVLHRYQQEPHKAAVLRKLIEQCKFVTAQGNLEDAEIHCEQAVMLAEEIYGEHHYRTAMVVLLLAKVCRLKGKRAESLLLADHAKSILCYRRKMAPAGGSSGFWELLSY